MWQKRLKGEISQLGGSSVKDLPPKWERVPYEENPFSLLITCILELVIWGCDAWRRSRHIVTIRGKSEEGNQHTEDGRAKESQMNEQKSVRMFWMTSLSCRINPELIPLDFLLNKNNYSVQLKQALIKFLFIWN